MRGVQPLKTALSAPGALSKLAAHLRLRAATVAQWRDGLRPVPVVHCWAIERYFNGAVTRRDLRPDDAHLIWPDLATEPATAGEGA